MQNVSTPKALQQQNFFENIEDNEDQRYKAPTTDDPVVLRQHIANLNQLLADRQHDILDKGQSLTTIIQANKAIEVEFNNFVNAIHNERTQQQQQKQFLMQNSEQKQEQLEILLYEDNQLKQQIENEQQQIEQLQKSKTDQSQNIKDHQSQLKKLQYLLQQEHHQNLMNGVFKQQGEKLQQVLQQVNRELNRIIGNYDKLKEDHNALKYHYGQNQQQTLQLQKQISQFKLEQDQIQNKSQIQENKLLQQEFANQQNENQQKMLKSQIQDLQQKLNQSTKSNNSLQNEKKIDIQKINDLNQIIEESLLNFQKQNEKNESEIQSLKLSLLKYVQKVGGNKAMIQNVVSSFLAEKSVLEDKVVQNQNHSESQNGKEQNEFQKEKQTFDQQMNDEELLKMVTDKEFDFSLIQQIADEQTERTNQQEIDSFDQNSTSTNQIALNQNDNNFVVKAENGKRIQSGTSQYVILDSPQVNTEEKQFYGALQQQLVDNGTTSIQQLQNAKVHDVFQEIVNLKKLLQFKDKYITELEGELQNKCIQLENLNLKLQQIVQKQDFLLQTQTENSLMRQQIDLLVSIKNEVQRSEQVLQNDGEIVADLQVRDINNDHGSNLYLQNVVQHQNQQKSQVPDVQQCESIDQLDIGKLLRLKNSLKK